MTDLANDAERTLKATFHTIGDVIAAPEGWRTDPTWQQTWRDRITRAVSEHNAWALLCQRPDGDIRVFGTDSASLACCASYGTRVRLIALAPPLAAGVALIAGERVRQVDVEGHTPEHDRFDPAHGAANLVDAAVAYLLGDPGYWPWEIFTYKPESPESDEPAVKDLVRAGALVAAAIDVVIAERGQEAGR